MHNPIDWVDEYFPTGGDLTIKTPAPGHVEKKRAEPSQYKKKKRKLEWAAMARNQAKYR